MQQNTGRFHQDHNDITLAWKGFLDTFLQRWLVCLNRREGHEELIHRHQDKKHNHQMHLIQFDPTSIPRRPQPTDLKISISPTLPKFRQAHGTILQNKANFPQPQNSATCYISRPYTHFPRRRRLENKPNFPTHRAVTEPAPPAIMPQYRLPFFFLIGVVL